VTSAAAEPAASEPDAPEAEPAEAEPAEAKPAGAKPAEAKPAESKPAEAKPAEKKKRGYWLWVVLVLLAAELVVYGHSGRIEVCVGLDGATDFSLKNQARTKENFRSVPQCADRLNVGMYDHAEDQARSALQDACGRATMVNKKEFTNCVNRSNKWTRQVTKDQIYPWDKRFYRRLFWLD
jgi:IS1 family transposase